MKHMGSPELAKTMKQGKVFQVVGTTVFVGYAAALWQMSISYGRGWSLTIKSTVDGMVYALLTAGTFGWLWPR